MRIARFFIGMECSKIPGLCRDRLASFRSRLCISEISGSLGDLGTLIPLLSACAQIGAIRMGPAVFWMGIFNVISALQWDIPMPVQPMKSIAAVAISDGMTPGAMTAAGVICGAVVMFLGYTGLIDVANKIIPLSVIAGMQVGLGVKMASKGFSYWPVYGWAEDFDCKITALLTFILIMVLMMRTKLPSALIVFLVGVALTIVLMLRDQVPFEFGFPEFQFLMPSSADWVDGLVEGAIPQLPLTTMNSVISVCALSVTLFGEPGIEGANPVDSGVGKGATRVSVASSVGLMNLIGCWFGGMPSCHGAGGLAGQYKFGARGGAAILVLGTAKIAISLCLGKTLDNLIAYFPRTVLGVMLVFAGVELASVGAKSLQKSRTMEADLLPCFVTAGAYIGMKNMALGVAAGLMCAICQGSVTEWKQLGAHFGCPKSDAIGKSTLEEKEVLPEEQSRDQKEEPEATKV